MEIDTDMAAVERSVAGTLTGLASPTMVYVVGCLTQGEIEDIWENPRDFARDQDADDLASPQLLGVFTTARKALRAGIDSLWADVREIERDNVIADTEGELLPGVVEETTDRVMATMLWVDESGEPADLDCPLKRRTLHDLEGEAEFGRPRYVAALKSPARRMTAEETNRAEDPEWSWKGTVVVEEVELL